jgi:hypothetical protein
MNKAKNIPLSFVKSINRAITSQNRLLMNSYLVQYIKAKLLNLYNKLSHEKWREAFFESIDKNNKALLNDAQVALDLNLQRLKGLSDTLGFKFIFIIIPDRCQVYPGILRSKLDYYDLKEKDIDIELPNKMLISMLRKYDIPYLDILPCLAYKGDGLYYVHDDHLTVAGNRAVVECSAAWLEGMISKVGRSK